MSPQSPDQEPRQPDRQTTRHLMIATGVVGVALLFAVIGWVLLPGRPLPSMPTSAVPGQVSPGQMINRQDLPAQREGESAAARNDPAGLEDPSGGRARAIQKSAQELSLTDAQKATVRDIIARQDDPPRLQETLFELRIGAAVPRQVPTRDIPPAVTEVMNGYWGSRYVLVQDKLVIVDLQSSRVAAIVPDMATAP